MTHEQIAEIGVSGKGYWLFDRNSTRAVETEGAMDIYGKMFRLLYGMDDAPQPWAIYKWIPYHRS